MNKLPFLHINPFLSNLLIFGMNNYNDYQMLKALMIIKLVKQNQLSTSAQIAEAYSEPCQISTMECSAKIVNG